MATENFNALASFAAVAEERSFTRAAAKLGVSQSALSQVVMNLETRLGLRLLTRTTRSVAPTEAGERLLRTLQPAFGEIEAEMVALTEMRDARSSRVRITTSQHAAETLLWPTLEKFMVDSPDVDVELSIDADFREISAGRFDAGVRLGQDPIKDMTAVRIGRDLRMMAVASPRYLERRGTQQTLRELAGHESLNFRVPTATGLVAWEHDGAGRDLNVRMEHRFASNDANLILRAALSGFGIAFLLEDIVEDHVAAGRLRPLIEEWRPMVPGYHLYYPNQRPPSPAFARLVDTLNSEAA